MSWTRHLYDPVGAIARDVGILGRDRRPMTEAERMRQRTLGTRRFGADDGVRHGGAGRGAAERDPTALTADEAATPMAKPMPVLADPGKGPGSAPVTTGATARYAGPGGVGLAVIPSANSGLQVGPEGGGLAPGRPQEPPTPPLPGQPGNAHTGRFQISPEQARGVEQVMARFRSNRPPVMSTPPVTSAPTAGRFGRRPRP